MYKVVSVLRNKRAKLYTHYIVDKDGSAVAIASSKQLADELVAKLNWCEELEELSAKRNSP
jgi:hypothetical protein